MNLLATFDAHNYDPAWPRRVRHAVRCIILRDNAVALVKSTTRGFYQIPGGGIDPGETHLQALMRETLEEVGLTICPDSVRPFGTTREIRIARFEPETIFDETSYYYFAQAKDEAQAQILEDYEKDLGYVLEWADPDVARRVNLELAPNYDSRTMFLSRDARILELLTQRPNHTP